MPPSPARQVFSISELTRQIRSGLESRFSNIWLEGEVSNYTLSSLGHAYFTLKDEASQLRVVIFKTRLRYLQFQPKNGMQLIIHGSISVYEKRGEYQLLGDYLEPKGIGSLQLAFEELKKRLHKEGLFSSEHKKPLPFLPRTIGIVTSPSGAVLHDILSVSYRRFPNLLVIVSPAPVQGKEAGEKIVQAIQALNDLPEVEVIILARGGGSLEDLWCFNSEEVARAIFASHKPIVSAVGHEVDFTIADFVADLRAPTPSAAAEMVVKDKQQLAAYLKLLRENLSTHLQQLLCHLKQKHLQLSQARCFTQPQTLILGQYQQQLDEARQQLVSSFAQSVAGKKEKLAYLMAALDALSPLQVLKRGYSICRKLPAYELVKEAAKLQAGDLVDITLSKGKIICEVKQREEESNHAQTS